MSDGPSFDAYTWGHPGQAMMPGLVQQQMPQMGLGAVGFGNGSIVDKIPQDMLYMVDPHWNQFPPLNPLMYSLLAFVVTMMGLVSIIGNFVVVYVFMGTRSLKTPSNLLVVNLAFSDLLMMAAMFPFMAISNFYETWAFGPLMCELYGFIGSLSGCMSIWSMAMIAMDRYNVIVKGIAAKPMTYKKALGMILFVDTASLVWCIVPFFGWNRYVPEGNMTVCGTDSMSEDWFSRSYVIAYAVWVYFLPLLTILYSYFQIVKAVAEHEEQMREQAKKMNVQSLRSADASKTSAEIRLAKIAMMTISLWFMAWTPYLIINFRGIFNKDSVTPLFTVWGSLFAKCAAVYNPIVYGISHPKYRAALYEKFPCLACRTDEDDEDVRSTTTAEVVCEKPALEQKA
jgi:r-opsin